jgi:hypothetical protein
MSIYKCGVCDRYRDADIHGYMEHPKKEDECVCDNCHEELSAQACPMHCYGGCNYCLMTEY